MLKKTLSVIAIAMTTFSFSQVTELNENFDAGFPAGWSLINDGNTVNSAVSEYTDAWIMLEKDGTPGDSIISSTSYFEPTGIADRWLITPKVKVGNEGNILSWYEFSFDASHPDAYMVLVSTTTNEQSSFTDTVFNVAGADPSWLYRSVDLAVEGYVDDSIYVAFVNKSDDKFKLALDSINLVRDVPLSIQNLSPENEVFGVYPNPATNFITVVGAVEEVTILDLTGKVVHTAYSNEIVLNEIPAGVYIVNALMSNGFYSRTRLVKK